MIPFPFQAGQLGRGGSAPTLRNSLELHFEDTAGSAVFTDSSPYARTPTNGGSPVIASTPTVYAGNCGDFRGSNANITFSNYPGLDFGTGNMRIRVSVRFNSMLAQNQVLDMRGTATAPILYTVGAIMHLFVNSANRIQLSTGIVSATNYDIEVRRTNFVWSCWLNGSPVGTTYNDGGINLNGCACVVGAAAGVRQTDGWVDEVIIAKG